MSGAPTLLSAPEALRQRTRAARRGGLTVGFVPTMGALHRGHLSLLAEARRRADLVVVSVFVNPTQFGPGEDLDRYPRDLEGDLEACASEGADLVYAPEVEALYPRGHATRVTVSGDLTAGLCAPHRPEHFEGVATVVATLFNQVGPCRAVFGRKDYQQLKVIERLARDLSLEVEVIGAPTVREPDGLALSSRNAYLKPEERERALALSRGLSAALRLAEASAPERPSAAEVRAAAEAPLQAALDQLDYVTVADPDTLAPLRDEEPLGDRALVAVAGRVGRTRLIDNVVIGEDSDPL